MYKAILLLLLTHTALAQAPTNSPDFSWLDVPGSMAGQTLQTSAGVWNFGPNVSAAGGNEILLNGNNNQAGYGTLLQVGDSGKMFAKALDNSWWVYDPVVGYWMSSPGTPYHFTCTPPTSYTTGAMISQHLTFTFYRGTGPRDFSTEVTSKPTCDHTYYGLTGPNYVTVTAKDPSNTESALSNQVALGPVNNLPMAPTNLTAKAQVQAYAVKVTKDKITASVAVGTIKSDTPCDASQRVNEKLLVPVSAVTWYGNVRPQAVVAVCTAP